MTCVECRGETNAGIGLCSLCRERFLADLRGVPDLIEELDTAMSVLKAPARGGFSGGGLPGSEAPGDFTAMSVKLTLENLLHGMYWHTGHEIVVGLDAGTYVDAIQEHLHLLLAHKSLPSYVRQLRSEIGNAERVLEGASYRVILGPCETVGCGTTLYAAEGEPFTTCPTCGKGYDIRGYLQNRAMEALDHDGTPLRAAEAVRYLNKAGVRITTTDVKNWVRWGLQPADTDHLGRKRYNLIDLYKKADKTA